MSTSSCPWSDPALQTTRCRAVIDELKLNIDEPPTVIVEGLQSLAEGLQSISELVANQTAAIGNLTTEQNVLKGRQAASAALQVIQFLLFAGYLVTVAVKYVVKECRKHSKKRGEETVELLEQRLQERKSRRRAAAARQSSADK